MSKEVDQLREEREILQLRNSIAELKNEDWQVRVRALSGLIQIKKTKEYYQEALPEIIHATRDPNNVVREAAIPLLGDIGAASEIVTERLIEILDSTIASEVKAAVYALGKIGSDALPSIIKLIQLVPRSQEDVRKAISWSLSMLGPNAVPVLITQIHSPQDAVRVAIISALGNMGPLAEQSLDNLTLCLSDSSIQIKIEAAKAIGNLRAISQISKCIPKLSELLEDSDPDVRWTAAEALRKIGTEEAISAWSNYKEVGTAESYFKQLLNQDKSVRLHAAESLFSVLEDSTELDIVAVKRGLSDTYHRVIIELCNSLTKIAEKAVEFKSELIELLDHTESSVVISSLQLLGKSSCQDSSVITKIISKLSHKDKEVRLAAGLALEFIDSPEAKIALKKFKWE